MCNSIYKSQEYKELKMLISFKLRAIRCKNHQSQRQVAEAIGISQGSLSSAESGRYLPSMFVLKKLATFYGFWIDDLLGSDERFFEKYID